jgi:hypothetical protein
MFVYILKRVAMLVSIMLMLLGTVFYFSDSIKYEPMIQVIQEDYPQYEFYSTQPDEYDDLPIQPERIQAFHNLEYHMFNKENAINQPNIENEAIRGMDFKEVEEFTERVALTSGDIHDYYFPRAFFRYARGHYAVFFIVAAFETIRIVMAGDRERRRNVK